MSETVKSSDTRFQARRRGTKNGLRWQVELMMPVRFTLDEAAQAMALAVPEIPRRFGRRTCHEVLRAAARQGLYGDALTKADAELTEIYRNKLLEHEIFPPEAVGESGGA